MYYGCSSEADMSHLPLSDAHMVDIITSDGSMKNSKFLAWVKSFRMKEMNEFIEQDVFEVANKSEAQGLRVFGPQFMDTSKN